MIQEIPITKTQISNKSQLSTKIYDLEERTFLFAKSVAVFCKGLSRNVSNIEYAKQVIRASGSIGANYIEANESLSKKDFAMRLKICRKEAKESAYWLRLLIESNTDIEISEAKRLLDEAIELKKILSAMVNKV